MTLVAVCSLKGSPGVTTTAVALAARWPAGESAVVVECDPAGGDLLARFRLAASPGLVSLAAAARRGGSQAGLVGQHTQRLPGGVPVVVGPVGPEQARAALGEITSQDGVSVLRRAADQPGTVVIADCGRVDPDSPVLPLLRSVDVMVLLARSRDDDLAHVAARLHSVQRWSPQPCFVLVGNGYPTSEVSRELGIPVMARLPHDPKAAAVLSGQASTGTWSSRSALGRAVVDMARLTRAHAHRSDRAPAGDPAGTHRSEGLVSGVRAVPGDLGSVAVSSNGLRP